MILRQLDSAVTIAVKVLRESQLEPAHRELNSMMTVIAVVLGAAGNRQAT
jgi:hypothetical protein